MKAYKIVAFHEANQRTAWFCDESRISVLRICRLGQDDVAAPEHREKLLTDEQWLDALRCLDVGSIVDRIRNWSDQEMQLKWGVMTKQELRTVRMVLDFLAEASWEEKQADPTEGI